MIPNYIFFSKIYTLFPCSENLIHNLIRIKIIRETKYMSELKNEDRLCSNYSTA